jgi:hypothetical protein
MVPRLVSYARNGTVTTACTTNPQTSLSSRRAIVYDRGNWTETLAIFEDRSCSPESTMFTLRAGGKYDAASASPWNVAYRTITPTALGAAYLQQQCAQYPWDPGVAQNVQAGGCGSLASLAP